MSHVKVNALFSFFLLILIAYCSAQEAKNEADLSLPTATANDNTFSYFKLKKEGGKIGGKGEKRVENDEGSFFETLSNILDFFDILAGSDDEDYYELESNVENLTKRKELGSVADDDASFDEKRIDDLLRVFFDVSTPSPSSTFFSSSNDLFSLFPYSLSNVTNYLYDLFNFDNIPYFFDAMFAPMVGMLYKGDNIRIATIVDENEKVCVVSIDMANLPATGIMRVEVETDGTVIVYFSNGQVMSMAGESIISNNHSGNNNLLRGRKEKEEEVQAAEAKKKKDEKKKNVENSNSEHYESTNVVAAGSAKHQQNQLEKATTNVLLKKVDNSEITNTQENRGSKKSEEAKEESSINSSSSGGISNSNISNINSSSTNNDDSNNKYGNFDYSSLFEGLSISSPDIVSTVYSTSTFMLDKKCNISSEEVKANINGDVLVMKFPLKNCALNSITANDDEEDMCTRQEKDEKEIIAGQEVPENVIMHVNNKKSLLYTSSNSKAKQENNNYFNGNEIERSILQHNDNDEEYKREMEDMLDKRYQLQQEGRVPDPLYMNQSVLKKKHIVPLVKLEEY